MDATDVIVIVWLAIAVVCCRYTAAIWWDAVADYRWTEARMLPQSRVLTAQDQLMVHSILFSIQIIALIIGVVAALVPPPEQAQRIVAVRMMLAGGLVTIEVLLMLMAIQSRRNWRRILHLIERQNERAGEPMEHRETNAVSES